MIKTHICHVNSFFLSQCKLTPLISKASLFLATWALRAFCTWAKTLSRLSTKSHRSFSFSQYLKSSRVVFSRRRALHCCFIFITFTFTLNCNGITSLLPAQRIDSIAAHAIMRALAFARCARLIRRILSSPALTFTLMQKNNYFAIAHGRFLRPVSRPCRGVLHRSFCTFVRSFLRAR